MKQHAMEHSNNNVASFLIGSAIAFLKFLFDIQTGQFLEKAVVGGGMALIGGFMGMLGKQCFEWIKMAFIEIKKRYKMSNTKFGPKQLNNPTPVWAKRAFRVFFYVTSIVTIILDIFTEIPPDIKLVINAGVIKANVLVHAVSKLFGIDVDEFKQQ